MRDDQRGRELTRDIPRLNESSYERLGQWPSARRRCSFAIDEEQIPNVTIHYVPQ